MNNVTLTLSNIFKIYFKNKYCYNNVHYYEFLIGSEINHSCHSLKIIVNRLYI